MDRDRITYKKFKHEMRSFWIFLSVLFSSWIIMCAVGMHFGLIGRLY